MKLKVNPIHILFGHFTFKTAANSIGESSNKRDSVLVIIAGILSKGIDYSCYFFHLTFRVTGPRHLLYRVSAATVSRGPVNPLVVH